MHSLAAEPQIAAAWAVQGLTAHLKATLRGTSQQQQTLRTTPAQGSICKAQRAMDGRRIASETSLVVHSQRGQE